MTTTSFSFPRWFANRKPNRSPYKLGWGKTILLWLPMLLLTAFLLLGQYLGSGEPLDPLLVPAVFLTWGLFNVIFIAMLKSGHTDKYRAFLYITMAGAFIITFMTTIIETRGSLALTGANAIQGETPFCHLVIPMVILPAILTRTIIFPGSLIAGFAAVSFMLILWTGASLALGKGWCSWGCFYGGIEDGFSRILKKPVIKNIDRRWLLMPWAVLLVVVLSAALLLEPTYCTWFCPFKSVTEFEAVTSTKILIQTIIFVTLFISLVIVLPILTKRRTQCSFLCPLGALQGVTNKINVYDIHLDAEKCTQCDLCVDTCPTFSLDEKSYTNGHPAMTCVKCGKCVDVCPNHSISFHIKGTQPGGHPIAARVLFLYPAFVFLAIFGGGMYVSAIWRILRWITTGSMI